MSVARTVTLEIAMKRKILLRLPRPESLDEGDEGVFAKTPPPAGAVWVVEGPADTPSGVPAWERFVWVKAQDGGSSKRRIEVGSPYSGARRRVWMGRLRVLRPAALRVAERLMR